MEVENFWIISSLTIFPKVGSFDDMFDVSFLPNPARFVIERPGLTGITQRFVFRTGIFSKHHTLFSCISIRRIIWALHSNGDSGIWKDRRGKKVCSTVSFLWATSGWVCRAHRFRGAQALVVLEASQNCSSIPTKVIISIPFLFRTICILEMTMEGVIDQAKGHRRSLG